MNLSKFASASVIVACVATSLASTPADAAGGALAVTATLTPNAPTAKRPANVAITVKDASGKPVTGAMVRVVTSMPTMSMKGVDLIARDTGRGTYSAVTKLNYPTKWAVDITAHAKGSTGTTHVERDVK